MAFDISSAVGGEGKNYEASTGLDRAEVNSNSLSVLRMLAEEQLAAELKVADLEERLKTAKEELATIATKKLPEFMQEHDLPEFKFIDRATGATMIIKLDEVIRVSIPKGKRGAEKEDKTPAALKFFRSTDNGGSITKEFVANLGPRDDEKVQAIINSFCLANPGLDTRIDEAIAPATVTKIVTKMLKEGKSITAPDGSDIFTIYRQTQSTISAL